MDIYLTSDYELENKIVIVREIRKKFPNVEVKVSYDENVMKKILKRKKMEKIFDQRYSKSINEENLRKIINYYSDKKKKQEIY